MADEEQSRPTLIYFNARGRAELVRLILAYAEVDYVDRRITSEDWSVLKPNTPFYQLPIFKIEDVTLCQSLSISRYLAKKYGLAGNTELEDAQIDMVVDCIDDTIKNIFIIFFEKDEDKKARLSARFEKETLPRHVGLFEKMLSPKDGQNNFFIGDRLTWADISFMNLKDYLTMIHSEISFVKFPIISSYIDQIASIPSLAAWIANRPATDF